MSVAKGDDGGFPSEQQFLDMQAGMKVTEAAADDKRVAVAHEEKGTPREHVVAVLALSAPIIASSVLSFSMVLVDFAMVGHLGKIELGGAALATTWFNLVNHPIIGAATGLDTLFAQSFGADQKARYGDWLVAGVCLLGVLCIPCVVVLSVAEPCLVAMGQNPKLSKLAGGYCLRLIPGLPAHYGFVVLTKYLQAQGILAPSVWVGLAANLANAALNYGLIYGLGMGFYGAPIATTALRWVQLGLLGLYLRRYFASHAETWPRSVFGSAKDSSQLRRDLLALKKLALPGAYMLALEAWAFEVGPLSLKNKSRH
mmetsp:Transcript_2302/g.4933  ORF Transcript_2302/g.4933 Transcript_2302/m.4933 type:complete len:313 (+) Transcript_2302:38-976(+)